MSRRLFVDDDAYGGACVWEFRPDRPSAPLLVLNSFDVVDENLWDAIVQLVESGGVL